MADASVAQKLKYKPGMVAALLHVPAGVDIGVPADGLVSDPAHAAFMVEFAATQMEAEARLRALAPAVGEKTVAWIGYPKGSRAAGYDLNRDTIAAAARTVGLVVNASISIDGTWSALRVRPLRPGE
jgi:hypothetical protein